MEIELVKLKNKYERTKKKRRKEGREEEGNLSKFNNFLNFSSRSD